MRTTIRIDDDLYRRVKTKAAASGRTVAELIEDAVRDSLRPREPSHRKPRKLPTVDGTGVMPGIDLSSNAALLDVMDEERPLDALH